MSTDNIGINIHKGGGRYRTWSAGVTMMPTTSWMIIGLTPWTRLYSLDRSLSAWEERLMDYRTVTITFPTLIIGMVSRNMITEDEAHRLTDMALSANREDHMMLVMILKEIYKTKKHVYR